MYRAECDLDDVRFDRHAEHPLNDPGPVDEVLDLADHDCNAAPDGQLWLAPWQLDAGASCESVSDAIFE